MKDLFFLFIVGIVTGIQACIEMYILVCILFVLSIIYITYT